MTAKLSEEYKFPSGFAFHNPKRQWIEKHFIQDKAHPNPMIVSSKPPKPLLIRH